MPSIHAQKLERFLGADQVANIVNAMRGWYGPPIPVGRVPGCVKATADGDFVGSLNLARFSSLEDKSLDQTQRFLKDFANRRSSVRHGFTSLSDMIAEATGGKRREFVFAKTGTTGAINLSNSLWRVGAMPPAGANASNAPGGDAPTDATTGAFPFTNPTGGDTQHFVSGFPVASVASNTLMLYDRIFQVNKTMNSIATEAVTGVPTRYQSTTPSDPDYVGGNFMFVEVGTALAATAHNWTVCQYTNQAGTPTQNLPSFAGRASAAANSFDHAVGQWFAPLAGTDTGIKALEQMQCDALVATGVANFVLGHVLAFMPCPVANMVCVADGINSAFNLARIFDDAALAFIELQKPATTATTYNGSFTTVAG
jgi:hypothetical protein